MKFLAIVGIIILLGASLYSLDHYEWFQKPRDMDTIRRQFHLHDGATFVHFDSNPKSFRPEGLKSEAVIQFSEAAFAAYLAELDSRDVWRPVPLTSYSPAIADEYAADALAWRSLPLPAAVLAFARQRRLALPTDGAMKSGRYFCSMIDMRPVGFWEHNPTAPRWKSFGEACHSMTPTSSSAVVMLGILDPEARRLHVALGFSG